MWPNFASVPVPIHKVLSNRLLLFLAAAVAIGSLPIICETLVMSSLPQQITSWVCMLWEASFVLLFLGLLVTLVPAFCLLIFERTRGFASHLFAFCLTALLLSVPSLFVSREIRMEGLRQMGARTKPLIAAIEAFHKQKGRPPKELADLVPQYLPAIPHTGIGSYPDYDYTLLKNDTDPWQLSVLCSVGMLNWDEYYYRPSRKYPERCGGWVEPDGDWAYFHE